MLAKAAAHASIPNIRGTVYLDSHDVKIIQYKAAIYKLGEMGRILKVVEKNIEKTGGSSIIPLVNYVLSLCEGPMFNVNPVIRKRYQLLCEFKLCKVTPINPALSTSDIDLTVQFPQVTDDFTALKEKIYDADLQSKLLNRLQRIISNTANIYEKRLRQIQMERNAKRPTDSSGRPIPFDINTVEDLLRPCEVSLCLDLAVLINDKEQDTSIKSLRKLQTQVLVRFISCMNEKAFPVIRTYYNQLQKYVATRGLSSAALKELPHWDYSIHRIYALLFRVLGILDVTTSLTRQIYVPSRIYLHAVRTKLLSENVFAYNEVLQKLDTMCTGPENETIDELLTTLGRYSRQGAVHHVQPNNILEVYQSSISKMIPIMRNYLQLLSSFVDMWKFIESNTDAAKTFANHEETQLLKMLEERIAVDKLAYIEKSKSELKLQQNGTPLTSNTSSRTSLKRSLTGRVGSSTSSSASSSSAASPGKMSPLRMSRASSTERQNIKISNLSSPQISRRGSIAEGRGTASPTLSKFATDQKNTFKSPLGNKYKVVGRPRSSSLQSPLDEDRNVISSVPLQSRSNSLQADAALNQKMIQDAVGLSMTNGNGTSNGGDRSLKKLPQSSKLSRSPSTNNRYPDQITAVYKESPKRTNSDSSPLPEMASLNLNSCKMILEFKSEEDGEHGEQALDGKDAREEETFLEISCMKKVRFTGVPPMTNDEERSPIRKGWYKKPAILHYPPPPPQFAGQKFKMRQEGMAFRTSLREVGNADSNKKASALMSTDVVTVKGSASQRLTSKIRDKLR